MTLYLKYRSQNVEELDMASVRGLLKKMIETGSIPHALLFLGPKGTGKTSAARILAKAVNCEHPGKGNEPCNKCGMCTSISKGENLDVIEIDAASHRGIDDIRGLRDAVKLSPSTARRKVYIIDEAHMLTTEASNALLKTLEEPPEHVMFILATTNPEKLIDTIRSRTTNITFGKASKEEIIRALKRVIKGEEIKCDDETLEVISDYADGSFRDAVKALEQLSAGEKSIDKSDAEELVYGKSEFNVEKFLDLISSRDSKAAVFMVERAAGAGVLSRNMINSVTAQLKTSLLALIGLGEGRDIGLDENEILSLLRDLGEAYSSPLNSVIDQLALESCIIRWTAQHPKPDGGNLKRKSPEPKDMSGPEVNGKEAAEVPYRANDGELVGETALSVSNEIWSKIMSMVRPINASTEALLRAARPLTFDGQTLTLGVYYKFHKERLEEVSHRSILEEIITQILGQNVRVRCMLSEPPAAKIIQNGPEENGPLPITDKVTSATDGIGISSSTVLNAPDAVLTETKDTDIIKIAEEIFGN